jgi:hypothetical protein
MRRRLEASDLIVLMAWPAPAWLKRYLPYQFLASVLLVGLMCLYWTWVASSWADFWPVHRGFAVGVFGALLLFTRAVADKVLS